MISISNFNLFIILLILIFPFNSVNADVKGSDLMQACRTALKNGFQDVNGMMCTWYVTPCNCESYGNPEVPRVCLPVSVSVESLAKEVISGLQNNIDLQQKGADISAAIILSQSYPCNK